MGNKITRIQGKQEKGLEYEDIPHKDFQLLHSIGFEIKQLIGSGEVGSVYRGVYGSTVNGMRDCEGQRLDVIVGQEFALKFIDIKQREDFELRNGRFHRMATIRRFVEKEKKMRRKISNSDLLEVSICLNLGQSQTICLNSDPLKPIPLEEIDVRPSYDRIYLLMDFTKYGNLEKYLLELSRKGFTVSQTEANIWCKQLLSSLKYLHESDVFDVNIKPKNILMFDKWIPSLNKTYVIPKLSDFWMNDFFRDQRLDNQLDGNEDKDSEEEEEEDVNI